MPTTAALQYLRQYVCMYVCVYNIFQNFTHIHVIFWTKHEYNISFMCSFSWEAMVLAKETKTSTPARHTSTHMHTHVQTKKEVSVPAVCKPFPVVWYVGISQYQWQQGEMLLFWPFSHRFRQNIALYNIHECRKYVYMSWFLYNMWYTFRDSL